MGRLLHTNQCMPSLLLRRPAWVKPHSGSLGQLPMLRENQAEVNSRPSPVGPVSKLSSFCDQWRVWLTWGWSTRSSVTIWLTLKPGILGWGPGGPGSGQLASADDGAGATQPIYARAPARSSIKTPMVVQFWILFISSSFVLHVTLLKSQAMLILSCHQVSTAPDSCNKLLFPNQVRLPAAAGNPGHLPAPMLPTTWSLHQLDPET